MTKRCCRCKIEKESNSFSPSQFILGSGMCRMCVRDSKAKYRKNNPEKNKEYAISYYQDNRMSIIDNTKKYYQKNKGKIFQIKREYYQNNKSDILAYKSVYRKNRRANDPNFKIRESVSLAVRQAIKLNGGSKDDNSILQFLPYTIQELKDHLQSLFEPWMTWQNWGKYNIETWENNNHQTWKWQIDHIIPQSELPYTSMDDENFQKCWALNNLQPLSAKQNLMKSNNRNVL